MRWFVAVLLSVLVVSGHSLAQSVELVANAGPDQAVACVGQNGTPVALSGLGSSVGSGITYLWTGDPAVSFDDPTRLGPIGRFPVGTTLVTLTVTYTDPVTNETSSASDSAFVVIGDATPPQICACADPASLWPPNHKLHDVQVRIRVYDSCDADPDVELISVWSSEPDNGIGDGNTDDDIQGAEIGTDDREFQVRAERSGPGDGRTYSALYRVWDLAENHSDATAVVVVPHDQRHGAVSDPHECRPLDDYIRSESRASKRLEKAQLKAAKKAAKAIRKAQRAALRSSR